MMLKLAGFFVAFIIGVLALEPVPVAAQAKRECTFQSLSPDEKSRYQSRYRRRVRLDGQAFADKWLHDQVCMTAEQRKARDQANNSKKGKNCRAVSRPVTSMDGSMTVGIGRKCD